MPTTRRPFDPDDVIAIRIEREGGYRQAADPEWRFVPVGDLRATRGLGRLDLEPILLDVPDAPSIVLERLAEGDVLVESSMPLAVLPYGDSTPRRVDGRAELEYGSVFRAGPVLVAPLYAEQAESISEGRLVLYPVGEAGPAPEGPSGDPDEDLTAGCRRARRGTRTWGWIWGASFALPLVVFALAAFLDQGTLVLHHPIHVCFAVLLFVLPSWILSLVMGLPIHRLVEEWSSRLSATGIRRSESLRRRVRSVALWYGIWTFAFVAVGFVGVAHAAFRDILIFGDPNALACLVEDVDIVGIVATLVAACFPVFLLGLPIHFVVAFREPAPSEH